MATLASIYAFFFPESFSFYAFKDHFLSGHILHSDGTCRVYIFGLIMPKTLKLAIRGSFSIHIYLSPDSLVVVKLGC
jgi:hypothetical protein